MSGYNSITHTHTHTTIHIHTHTHTHTCHISYLDATVLARVLSVEAFLWLALVFVCAIRIIDHAVVHTPVHLWSWGLVLELGPFTRVLGHIHKDG